MGRDPALQPIQQPIALSFILQATGANSGQERKDVLVSLSILTIEEVLCFQRPILLQNQFALGILTK